MTYARIASHERKQLVSSDFLGDLSQAGNLGYPLAASRDMVLVLVLIEVATCVGTWEEGKSDDHGNNRVD